MPHLTGSHMPSASLWLSLAPRSSAVLNDTRVHNMRSWSFTCQQIRLSHQGAIAEHSDCMAYRFMTPLHVIADSSTVQLANSMALGRQQSRV